MVLPQGVDESGQTLTQDPEAPCRGDGLEAMAGAELGQQVLDVFTDRRLTQNHVAGDRLRAVTVGQERENLALARGQARTGRLQHLGKGRSRLAEPVECALHLTDKALEGGLPGRVTHEVGDQSCWQRKKADLDRATRTRISIDLETEAGRGFAAGERPHGLTGVSADPPAIRVGSAEKLEAIPARGLTWREAQQGLGGPVPGENPIALINHEQRIAGFQQSGE